MSVFVAALAQLALLLLPQAATDEEAVRGMVQQYYEAQSNKDADKAAAFWSISVNPRMTRESYLAVFSAGDATYTPEVLALKIQGSEARLRVAIAVVRTVVRDGVSTTARQTLLNAQLWRKEGAAWKLIREGPFAEDFADQLIAAAPADRARLMEENQSELNGSLRYVLAQRASRLAGDLQYVKAGELFDLALSVARAAKDRRGESETLQNIANGYYFQATTPGAPEARDAFNKAAEYYGQRLTLAREMEDEEAIAASLMGLATVSYSRGEYTPAVAYYREALAIYEKRDEGASIGRTLISIGNVQFLQAEYDEAAASYRRGLALVLAGMDPQGATFGRAGLARVFGAQGDYASALDMYGQVLIDTRAAAALDPRMKANPVPVLESIGDIHFRLGNTDQARAAFEQARQLTDPFPLMAGRVLGELGLTEIVAGRFDAALTDYNESRARFELAKNAGGMARAWTGIGFSHAAREKFTDAIPAYRTAIRMFEAEKDDESSGRAWLGLSIAQSGALDFPAALESAEKVRTIAALVKSEDLSWRAEVRVGEVLRKLSRGDEALRAFQDAVTRIDRIAAEAPTNPEARHALDDSASAWSGLALARATAGDASGALSALEARHAHIRRVQLSAFQRDITRGATPEELADEQAIVRELISTRVQLKAEQGAAKPDQARLDRLQQQLTTLVTKRADQQARLYARVPELQVWRGLSTTDVAPGDLAKNAAELLVEYLVADEELLAVTVAHGESGADIAATVTPFKRRDLADKIEQATQVLVLQDPVEWRKKAMPLAAALLDPIAATLRDRDRIVVVPDDVLWKVPFEALPSGDADLSSRARVTYATSLATLAAEHAIPVPPPSDHLVAGIAGAPTIPAVVRAQVALTSQGWKEPDAEVSLAAAGAVAKAYGDAATLKTAADANEAAVRALVETSDIVHVVAPLQMSGPTPLFSSLLLGGGADTPDNDGRWEAREWFNVNGRARVVVMPDASTFGAAGIGGAMDVFAWAAAAAHIPSLVVGRAPRDGFAPGAFLAALHAQLAKGVPVGEAWRAATLSARAKAGPAPAGWAGLRLLGDPR